MDKKTVDMDKRIIVFPKGLTRKKDKVVWGKRDNKAEADSSDWMLYKNREKVVKSYVLACRDFETNSPNYFQAMLRYYFDDLDIELRGVIAGLGSPDDYHYLIFYYNEGEKE